MPPTLDLGMYPHVLHLILSFCPPETLTHFAATSKTIREKIFHEYLPVKRVILDSWRGVLGVKKDNTAMEMDDSVIMRNRSGIHLIDMIGRPCHTPDEFTRIICSVPAAHFRISPFGRPDVFVTGQLQTKDWTARLPFSVDVPLGLGTRNMFYDFLSGVFNDLAGGDGRTALVFLENQGYDPAAKYHAALHRMYESMLIDRLVNWLMEPPFAVRLVFVNIEGWIKFKHPEKSVKDVRETWFAEVKQYLARANPAPDPATVASLNNAAFMSLDEYEHEVGAATFEVQTRFCLPAFDKA